MREPPHATVAAVVEQEGRFLLVHERAEERAVYNQPAGHLDPGESLLAAVVRETMEETAWEVEPRSLIGLYTYHSPHNGVSYLRACFSARALTKIDGLALDEGIIAADWHSLQEVEALEEQGLLRSPLVLQCIRDHLAGHNAPLSLVQDF